MFAGSHGVRWDVTRGLYERLARLSRDGEEAEAIDRAISLSISPSRRHSDVAAFGYRDLMRNGRFSSRRSRQRQAKVLAEVGAHARLMPSTFFGDGIGHGCLSTPEDVVIARESIQRMREASAELGPQHVQCLESMLAGSSVDETARVCGLSPSSVDRMRTEIRDIARPILWPEA